MGEQLVDSTTDESPGSFLGSTNPRINDRTKRVDQYFSLLANRRRRYCLYHLHLEQTPLSIRELAARVERSISPPGTTLTTQTLDDAVHPFVHNHLPKLRNAGLIHVSDAHVGLRSDPPFPIEDWLNATAAVELDPEWETRMTVRVNSHTTTPS